MSFGAVADVFEVDAIVLHNGAASARIRCADSD
jgi:hypothetical protein